MDFSKCFKNIFFSIHNVHYLNIILLFGQINCSKNEQYMLFKIMLNNKTILITGGTGSFGKAFTSIALKKFKKIKKIIIFSRDELKQFEMSKYYENSIHFDKIRFFLGDIRDKERLDMAFKDVDIVLHAAALKQVPLSEYNPFETIKTNVFGTQNVVETCIKNNVSKLLCLLIVTLHKFIWSIKLCSDEITVSTKILKKQANSCTKDTEML